MRAQWKKVLFDLTDRFEETKAFMAVRQGLTMMIPLIVLGALALTVKSLPIRAYQKILPEILDGGFVEFLDFVYAGTFRIFSLALAITTSVSYARIRNVKTESDRAVINDCFILVLITLISLIGYMGIQKENFSVSAFGTTNTFMALLIALGCGWFYFGVKESRIVTFFRKPDTDVEGMYYIAVQSIVPAFVVVSLFAVFNQFFRWVFHVDNIQTGMVILMETLLEKISSGFGTGLLILLAIHVMWFFGLHGSNVLDSVIKNHFAVVDGIAIYNKTFQDVFVIMGGCGAALGLVIAILLFSRKRMMKNVAKLALPSIVFNISEVIVFGLPIIFNPIFFIPFILVPLLNYVISYSAMYFELVPRVISQVEWTAPIFLSGYQATGSVAGSLLQLVCLVADILIYLPFIRLFETHNDSNMIKRVNQLVEVLKEEEETGKVTVLVRRGDVLGSTARMLATDLVEAVQKKELFMLYQPQVDVNEKCIGAEALLRWKHPITGMIYPPLVIRLAKEIDILSDIEKQIFEDAATALERIQKETGKACKISVNITNASLMWDNFEEMVEESIQRHQISRELLWMEITEQEALSSSINISNKLQSLKEKGHKFLIDDFGMGHTSVLYLQTNSFEIVKIDGMITRNVLKNERYSDILKSIVYLGELLNFTTVAEYVETEEQVELLKKIGVDAFQGYYYSEPISLDRLIVWLKEH